MKWGVRRYQNKDGSLTEAGRARYGKSRPKYKVKSKSSFEKKQAKLSERERRMTEKEEIARRTNALKERQKNLKNLGRKDEQKQSQRDQQRESEKQRDRRNVRDMTDDELRAAINRYKLEKEYREILKGPETKTGAQVVAGILIKAGKDALGDASKAFMTQQLKKALGVKDEGKKKKENRDDNDSDSGSRQNNNNGSNSGSRRNNNNGSNSGSRRNADAQHEQDWNDFASDVAEFWRRRR